MIRKLWNGAVKVVKAVVRKGADVVRSFGRPAIVIGGLTAGSAMADVDFTTLATSVTTQVTAAITAAMPIAGLVIASYIGYRIFKKFAHG